MLIYGVDPYVKRRLDAGICCGPITSKGDLMLVYAVDPDVQRRLDAGICCGPIRQKET